MPSDRPLPGVRAAGVGEGGRDRYYTGDRPDIRELVPAGARRVLDVGCGAGALGEALKAQTGAEVVGIEVFDEAADLAEARLDRVLRLDLQTLTELPYPDGYFDAMTFGDVLEHMHDPHGLLRTLRRYLAGDGTIVCSIPNVKHWSVVFPLLVRDRFTYADSGLLDRTHIHFFTLEEIGAMLEETGFEATALRANCVEPVPAEVATLADYAARFGEDREEVLQRLNAYQYLVAARPV
ncbi:MAG: class I SAM-dependent methyltransferase [Solirubrobacteraceae bacterium]|nr:class I SAM-dependent methyltransferase [Solirubrobacteraceae bacterium]